MVHGNLDAEPCQSVNDEGSAKAPAQGSRPRNRLTAVMVANMTAIISGAAAFLLFAGNSYYNKLISGFGLHSGLIEISQIDMATMGFWSLILALLQLAKQLYEPVLKAVALATVLGGVFALAIWMSPKLRKYMRRFEQGFNVTSKWNSLILIWSSALLLAMTGILAGNAGGEYDLKAIRENRGKSKICYYIDGQPYRARVLIQDKARTILVHSDRTSLVSNDRINAIADCPDQRKDSSRRQS